MCGRYTHKLTWAEIVKLYQLTLPDQEPAGFKASYNVAPTDVMPIISGPDVMQALPLAMKVLAACWSVARTFPRSGRVITLLSQRD